MSGAAHSEADRDRIVEMREAGFSFPQIAASTGVRAPTVEWICLQAGAVKPQGFSPRRSTSNVRNGRSVRAFTPTEDALLLELEAEGHSYSEIARRLGRARYSVYGRVLTLARRQESELRTASAMCAR